MRKENILVAGATGSTGKIIIDILKANSEYTPKALVRKDKQKDYFENKGITTTKGDLEGNISHTTENIDKVIFAAGSGGNNVVGVDQEGAKKLIDAAKDKGVSKFVMLSSMGADNPSVSKELQDYLKAKQNADEYLRNSDLNFTIVRPGSLTNENGTGKIEISSKLDSFGEISRENVAKVLVKVLDNGLRSFQTFEIIDGNTSINEAFK